jgi:hypothetical protein
MSGLLSRINDHRDADCATCGGSRLSGTGHKAFCSGHILSPDRPRRESPWMRRAQAGELYGRNADGTPVAGKIMSGAA